MFPYLFHPLLLTSMPQYMCDWCKPQSPILWKNITFQCNLNIGLYQAIFELFKIYPKWLSIQKLIHYIKCRFIRIYNFIQNIFSTFPIFIIDYLKLNHLY
jgi:hypothetical protein